MENSTKKDGGSQDGGMDRDGKKGQDGDRDKPEEGNRYDDKFLFYPQYKLHKKKNSFTSINFASLLSDIKYVSPIPTYSSNYLPCPQCLNEHCTCPYSSDSDSDFNSNNHRSEEDNPIEGCWYNTWSDDSDEWL